MVKGADESLAVSGNNPCPFLRPLVSAGTLSDDREPLANVAAAFVRTAGAADGAPVLPSAARIGKEWTLNEHIQNLFDRAAPFDPQTCGGINYNPALDQAGAVGRYYRIGARYMFE